MSEGGCPAACPGLNLGRYSATPRGSRASNFDHCVHDFFRCARAAGRAGLPRNTLDRCCRARLDLCTTFVRTKADCSNFYGTPG